MTDSNWTMNGFSIRIIPRDGVLSFQVAGRLDVNAGQADGAYVGEFDVTVEHF